MKLFFYIMIIFLVCTLGCTVNDYSIDTTKIMCPTPIPQVTQGPLDITEYDNPSSPSPIRRK